MGAWRVKLANAVAVHGYATVDLRTIDRSPFVSLEMAMAQAQASYPSVVQPEWQSITQHLLTLKVLGVETLGLRAKQQRLHLVPMRLTKNSSFGIDEAKNYHGAMVQWLDALSEMLPKVSLTDAESKAAEHLKDWTGRYTGNAAVGAAVGKIVGVLAASDGKGSCTTVHPVQKASETFGITWGKTDLTLERFLNPKLQAANILWSVADDALVMGGAGGLENPDDNNFGLWIEDLATLLRSVTDT
jgi:hypothetical protein